MKAILALALLCGLAFGYDRNAAVNYAKTYWNTANHKCGTYTSCTPYSYWGNEVCGYSSHGGDCANFVSQCLLAGGHSPLNTGGNCRGYPCGKEEVGAMELAKCLSGSFGWERTCGYYQGPPSNIQPGDVLIYHADSCSSYTAHATLVVSTDNGSAQIACHSSARWYADYTYRGGSKPYYEWLHKN